MFQNAEFTGLIASLKKPSRICQKTLGPFIFIIVAKKLFSKEALMNLKHEVLNIPDGKAYNPGLAAFVDDGCTKYPSIAMDDAIFTGLELENGIYHHEIILFKEATA
jgi:hypothetical protein